MARELCGAGTSGGQYFGASLRSEGRPFSTAQIRRGTRPWAGQLGLYALRFGGRTENVP